MSILETVLSHETVVPMEKLTDITVTEDTNCLELDMTGNRWAEFNFVVLRLHPVDGPNSIALNVCVNGSDTGGQFQTIPNGRNTLTPMLSGSYTMDLLMVFFVAKGFCGAIHGLAAQNSLFYVGSTPYKFSAINKITFGNSGSTENPLKAGSTLEIWGIM